MLLRVCLRKLEGTKENLVWIDRMIEISFEDGEKAVRYARYVIEKHVKGEEIEDKPDGKIFEEKHGVFVTINKYPSKMLRGCIGIPEPIMPLKDALKEAAISACHDPRFPPLQENELDEITIEVSVLTKPELIKVSKPEEYIKEIKAGRDGLIIEKGFYRGLLLPQVATEYGWNEMEFLNETCMKAGLPPDCWFNEDVKIYRFQAVIFEEEEPRGRIVRKNA